MTVTRTSTHHVAAHITPRATGSHPPANHHATGHSTQDSFGHNTVRRGGTARSASNLSATIDRFNVAHNPKYLPHSGNTYCNVFAQDVTRALGAPLPALNANSTVNWLHSKGGASGWRKVTAAEAQSMANSGHPAIAIWKNTKGPHGHVGVIRPGQVTSKGPAMAQAGGHNFNNGHVRDGFGSRPVEYWVHS